MTDLSKLTAEELLRFGRSYQELISDSWWDEISVRLERLEKCEAAIRLSIEHFGDPLKRLRAALEGK